MDDPLQGLIEIEQMVGYAAAAVFGGLAVLVIAQAFRSTAASIWAVLRFRCKGFRRHDRVEIDDDRARLSMIGMWETEFELPDKGDGYERFLTVDNVHLSKLKIIRLVPKNGRAQPEGVT